VSVQPPAAPLRPLGIGEVLDVSLKVVTRHFKTLAMCVLVVTVPLAILDTFVRASTDENAFEFSLTPAEGDSAAFDTAMLGGLAASMVINVLLAALTSAACFRAVGAAYLGSPTTWQESLSFALRRLPSILLVLLLSGLAIAGGLVLCLVGSIWLLVALYFAEPALLFEDTRGVSALKRSYRLVRGRWWPTAGALFVAFLLVGVVQAAVGLLLGVGLAFSNPSTLVAAAATTLVTIAAYTVAAPVQAAIAAILYFDLRVRKEGFDLQLLAERIGAGPATTEVIAPIGYPAPPQPSGWPPPPPPPPSPGFLPPRPPEP